MAEKNHCEACNKNFPNEDALAMHNSAKHSVTQEQKKSYKKTISIILILSALLIGGFFLFDNKPIIGNSIQEQSNAINGNSKNSGEIQKITLGFKNYNYYPNTIQVKQGLPVEITLDSSIGGCFRTLVIKDLGVRKKSSNPSDKITFTPDKKGSFEFACGMHMGTGTIIVE